MEANLWVRNAEGQVWGPLPPKQIVLLVERKLVNGITEVSRDGRTYGPLAQEAGLAAALGKATQSSRPRTVSSATETRRASTASVPVAAPADVALTPVAAAPGEHASAPVLTPVEAAPSAPPVRRTPVPSKLLQVVPPSGRLEEHSPFKLYYLIAAAETGGKLVLGEDRSAVTVWFKAGTPHAIESATLGLGEFLIEQRVLSPVQLASVEPHIQRAGGDVASGLFAAGLLNPQTAFPLIQQHAQTLLQRGLLLDRGPFTFEPGVPVPASGFQLGQRWQLLSAAARRADAMRLRSWMRGRETQVPRLAGSTVELQLSAQETRLLAQLDGSRTLGDALAAVGTQAEALLRLVLLLSEIDRLTWGTASAAKSEPVAPAVASPVSVAPAAPSPPPITPPAGGLASAIAKAFADNAASGVGAPPAAVAPVAKPAAVVAQAPASPSAKPPAVVAPPPPAPAKPPAVVAPPPPAPAKPAAAIAPQPPVPAKPPAATTPPAPAKPPTAVSEPGKKTVVPFAGPAPSEPQASQKTVVPIPMAVATKPPADLGSNTNLPALRKFLEQLREKDYFARLSVERSKLKNAATKTNFFQLAKLYHPDTVPPNAPEEARKLKADILSLLNEASGVLSDDAKRAEYLDELEAREAVGDLDVEAILGAEEDFQQAVALARVRKFNDAFALLETCIQRNEKEGEFYAWRGYCRFFGAQDKRAQRDAAIEDQKKALALSPRCVVAWVFQGQIYKLLEEIPGAKAAFQKALDMDPRNADAQRELRLFEQRKR